MSSLLARTLRFSDAVHAVGTTPMTLRKWLQRGQVRLFSEEPEPSGWRAFSPADLAILSVVKKLVDHGLGVEEASEMAHELFAMNKVVLSYKNPPPDVLAATWSNLVVVVWLDGAQWVFAVFLCMEGGEPVVITRPSGRARKVLEYADGTTVDAHLSIDLEAVISRAFERAEAFSADAETSTAAEVE